MFCKTGLRPCVKSAFEKPFTMMTADFHLAGAPSSRCGRSCNYDLGFCFEMRAIWKGSIAFGLVHIPVNLYLSTETQSISSNLLHKKDHSQNPLSAHL
jgi:hypothetical protein